MGIATPISCRLPEGLISLPEHAPARTFSVLVSVKRPRTRKSEGFDADGNSAVAGRKCDRL